MQNLSVDFPPKVDILKTTETGIITWHGEELIYIPKHPQEPVVDGAKYTGHGDQQNEALLKERERGRPVYLPKGLESEEKMSRRKGERGRRGKTGSKVCSWSDSSHESCVLRGGCRHDVGPRRETLGFESTAAAMKGYSQIRYLFCRSWVTIKIAFFFAISQIQTERPEDARWTAG